jgi:hypothetical protein
LILLILARCRIPDSNSDSDFEHGSLDNEGDDDFGNAEVGQTKEEEEPELVAKLYKGDLNLPKLTTMARGSGSVCT